MTLGLTPGKLTAIVEDRHRKKSKPLRS